MLMGAPTSYEQVMNLHKRTCPQNECENSWEWFTSAIMQEEIVPAAHNNTTSVEFIDKFYNTRYFPRDSSNHLTLGGRKGVLCIGHVKLLLVAQ